MDPITSLFTEDTVLDIPSSTHTLFRIPFHPSNLLGPLTPPTDQLQILQNDDELRMLVDQTPTNSLLLTNSINHDNFQISPPPAESSSSPMELLRATEGGPGGGSGGEQININQTDRIVNPRDLGGVEVEEENIRLDTKKSKIVHREIERKRRNEMTSLHQSLRSHLPSEYLKGKRKMSISDQLNEAVKYIRHLQARIQALKYQRDGMRRSTGTPQHNNPSSSPYTLIPATYPQYHSHHQIRNIVGDDQRYGLRSKAEREIDRVTVSVSSWTTGGGGGTIFEVMVKSCISGETWALSKVIQSLECQGVEVVCSTSNKVDNKWLHFLRAEVGGRNVDPLELQENLIAEISQLQ